jgi:hypothetical protein
MPIFKFSIIFTATATSLQLVSKAANVDSETLFRCWD